MQQIAAMNRVEIREVHHRITIGVAGAHMKCAHFHAAQVNGSLVGEYHSWLARLVGSHHVVAGVLMGHHFGDAEKAFVAA